MNEKQLRTVLGSLRRTIGSESDVASRISDGQLRERFVAGRDEIAFEMLVWRHGSMVLNVCRRVLRDSHEAEDAFQATFLVFARKLATISKGESIGSWLYKVAYRVALRSRGRLGAPQLATRRDWEDLPGNDAFDDPAQRAVWSDLRPVLDEEVNRLPEKYRTPFVLICLEGMAYPEVARELRCPKGTVSSRLTAAKGMLRKRLARRGVVLSAALLGAGLGRVSSAAVTVGLTISTMQTVKLVTSGSTACAAGSSRAISLAQGVLRSMLIAKAKLVAALVIGAGVLGFGTSMLVQQVVQAQGQSGNPAGLKAPSAQDPKVEGKQDDITLLPPGSNGDAPPAAKQPTGEKPKLWPPDPGKDDPIDVRFAKIEARLARLEAAHQSNAYQPQMPGAYRMTMTGSGPKIESMTHTVHTAKFNIPVAVSSKVDREDMRELALWVSEDQGQTWKKAVAIDPKMTAFPFDTPSDGTFWFKVQVVGKNKNEPEAINGTTPPDLKMHVVTNRPKPDKEAMLRDLETQLRAIQKKIADLKGDQTEESPER
jgi:RNA polymerase sigma factor (sigma-70 family)